jgi:hypothetical protein
MGPCGMHNFKNDTVLAGPARPGAILLPTLESLLCLSNPQFESEIGSVHEPRQAAFRLDVRDSPRNEYRRDSSFSNPFELSDSAKPFPAFHMLS